MWGVFKNFFGISDPENKVKINSMILTRSHEDDKINDIRISDNSLPVTFGFSIVTDPLQMHSYFEKQMDDLLKNSFNFSNIFQGMVETPLIEENYTSLRDDFLKPGYNQDFHEDSDLDGVLSSKEIDNYFDAGKKETPRFFSRSVVIRSVRLPDGTTETVQIERNNDGKEETIVYNSSDHSQPNNRIDLSDIEKITKLFF